MSIFDKSRMISDTLEGVVFRLPSDAIKDEGKVRLGGQGPVFRKASIEDQGKVRLGGQGPIFRR